MKPFSLGTGILTGLSGLHLAFAKCPSSVVLAGQHVIYSYPGLTPPEHLFEITRQGKVGGVILFRENIGNNTASIISRLQDEYAESPGSVAGAPLLIMTDQEGGLVRRIANAGPYLSAKEVGESVDPSAAAAQAGREAAQALRPYGINTNLAPVLDVFREANNFIDEYQRSFGNTSSLVARCAKAFISAQQEAGVIATAKHFPGLGAAAASENTDESPVQLDLTLEELRSVDEEPYTNAIDAKIDMIMTSWATYPALDPAYPAGLSTKWVQGELRGRLGFRGVTITDALEAGGLEAFGDTEKRAIRAALVGMDLILASARNVTQGELAVDAIRRALDAKTLPRDEFFAGTQRIMDLRQSLQF